MIQLQYLNAILNSGDASLITVNNLTKDFFSDYQTEFIFIKSHLDQYGKIPDQATFLSKFPDFDIIQVNETQKYLLDALYEDRNKRELAKVFNKVREALNAGDTEKALKIYTGAVDNISQAIHLDSVNIFEDLSRYDVYVERSTDFSKYYVTTGFKELDDIIGGWDRKEELATIAARTNQGKSWLLLKCAIAAAEQGLNVGIYSGEMSENKVGYRVDTLISHISNSKMIHGDASIQVDYKRYLESLKSRMKGTIRVLTPAMINGAAGVTALRAFIEKDKLDMLCVDQHSLLEDDKGAKNPTERAANISRDLKNLQVMKKIPIIAVSQQNREKNENGPDTTNIAQSDRIGQDSTVILFFEQKDGVLTIYLTKSRDSVNGKTLKYAIDLDKGIFNYIPTENDAKGGVDCQALKNEYEAHGYEDEPF